MNWFNNINIRGKLILGFLTITAITIILGYTGYSWTTEIVGYLNAMYAERLVPIRELGFANESLLTLRGDFVASLGTKDLSKRQGYINSIKNESAKIDKLIEKYSKTVLVKEEQEFLPKFLSAWSAYRKYHDQTITYILNKHDEQAAEILYVDSFPYMLEARKNLHELININSKIASDLQETSNASANKAVTFLIVFILVSASGALCLSFYVSKTISKKINNAVFMLQELSRGHLGKRLDVDSNDEVGVMAQTMNQFADDLQKYVVGSMKRISEGDFNFDIPMKDKDDEIAPALNLTTNTLREIKTETDLMRKWAADGELDRKGNEEKFKGGYNEIIMGFNNTIQEIVTGVRQAEKVMEILSTGDLTARMEGDYKGDYKRFQDYVNNLGESLENLVHEINLSIAATASAAAQISSSSEEMASGTHEQTQQVNEIASAIEEMTKTIIETTKHVTEASEEAKQASQTANDGTKKIENTKKSMDQIVSSAQSTAAIISELSNKTDQIGEITQVIDDIADQTNLLALNAAIEAARAGEQGRGFAVVADEVRKLAERTTKATKEIAETIKKIQSGVTEADRSMSVAKKVVGDGIELTKEIALVLSEINDGSNRVDDIIAHVAAASEEQSATSQEISQNITGISSVIHQSATGVEQIARAAEDLNRLTVNLQELVSRFKLSNSKEDKALNKHFNGNSVKLVRQLN